MRRIGHILTLAVAIALCASAGFAQEGKLKIKVTPPQAYVFVDGNAIREGSYPVKLGAGKHTVVVVNYGYKMSTQEVNIEAGKNDRSRCDARTLRRQSRGTLGPGLHFRNRRARRCSIERKDSRIFRRARGRV